MQHIIVTPMPEIVSNTTSWSEFVHSFTIYDIISTVITLGALTFAFYMFFSFSKYGKHGRDVSKETQEHDKQSLINHGLIPPLDPVDAAHMPTQIKQPGTQHPPVARSAKNTAGHTTKKGVKRSGD